MLTKDIIDALKSYTQHLQKKVTLVLQTGEHAKRTELLQFLIGIAEVSEQISVEQRDQSDKLRSPISFLLEVNGEDCGIRFSGIPAGHEFNSLVLAILHASGTALKLDDRLKKLIGNVQETLQFEVFISLSCHNCPDVVQALNQFALLNDNITTEMIDGGLFQRLINERDIQGVPSVYVNGELFANGKISTAELIDKLIERAPAIALQPAQAEQLPVQDVVIVGAGPAGVAAAIYSARKGLHVALVADRLGGQVKDTVGIENLISVPKTTGSALTGKMLAHLQDYNITLKEHVRVDTIEQGNVKKIRLSSGEVIESKTIIVATGAKWRELGVPGEKENIGNGVAYCPHCDGPFFKGKDVAVIGGGNSGIEAALDLAGIVSKVTVFEFLPQLKADSVLVAKARANNKITIITNVATKAVIADNGKVVALDYQHRDTGESHRQALSGIFVQIGLLPNSGFVRELVDCTPHGEIIINQHCETSAPGIFACGDVTTVPYKQIVIAMGEGAKASLSAFDYLIRHRE